MKLPLLVLIPPKLLAEEEARAARSSIVAAGEAGAIIIPHDWKLVSVAVDGTISVAHAGEEGK